MKLELHVVQHTPHESIISLYYDTVKMCFENTKYCMGNQLEDWNCLNYGHWHLKNFKAHNLRF